MVNKVYQHDETAITWSDSGSTYAMTLNYLATVTGRQGAVHDFGTAARASLFAWRAWVRGAATPTVGNSVQVYAKTSDGTSPDNDDGTGDIALSSVDKLKNLDPLGVIFVDEASTSVTFVAHGTVYLPYRYFMPVFYNNLAVNLLASANVSGFSLTPVPPEVQ